MTRRDTLLLGISPLLFWQTQTNVLYIVINRRYTIFCFDALRFRVIDHAHQLADAMGTASGYSGKRRAARRRPARSIVVARSGLGSPVSAQALGRMFWTPGTGCRLATERPQEIFLFLGLSLAGGACSGDFAPELWFRPAGPASPSRTRGRTGRWVWVW